MAKNNTPMIHVFTHTPEQKDLIMSNVKHLKDKCNGDGAKYFIVDPMPDAVKGQCRQTI